MNLAPQSAMQRIQVGLIGLIAVLLFVTIANMVFDPKSSNEETLKQSSANKGPNADKGEASQDEPLAELGVAPAVAEQLEKAPQPPANPTATQ